MRRIAEMGLRYSNFHTTALCSPTRSCLMTGRNATSNNMALITEGTNGFPGSSGRIPFENGTIAEVLNERGWNTYAVGKWHLTPAEEEDASAWKHRWPLGRGFERFYGFMGGETNQWYPDLIYDNHPIDQPYKPEDGYHLSKDLVDKAIEFIRDAKVVAPDKPFFMYFCPGCAHAPHHVFKEWADKYKGQFDMGYEAIREAILANQKKMGILPENTSLSPINPHGEPQVSSPDGKPWPLLDWVRRGIRCPTTRRRCLSAWLRCMRGLYRIPITILVACSITSRSLVSLTTRSSSSPQTTARAARAVQTVPSMKLNSLTMFQTR